jgi:2-haloacid dehalogenase
MLRANAKNSGIESAFEFYLSTDRVQAYKPSPLAYQMGIDAFGLPKEDIAFAAFG